jgi:hypothetical protein
MDEICGAGGHTTHLAPSLGSGVVFTSLDFKNDDRLVITITFGMSPSDVWSMTPPSLIMKSLIK